MAVEGVMVTYNYSEDGEHANILTVSASGIRFSERWVLTHGSILSPLKEAKIIKKAKGKPILSDEFYANLPEMHVTCEKKQSKTPNLYESVEKLSRKRNLQQGDLDHSSYLIRVLTGRICHVWQCPVLDRCADDILYSWTIGHRDGDIDDQMKLGNALFSVFVLIDLESDKRGVETLRPLSALLDIVRPPTGRGSILEVHSTPFGCEVFLNAVTRGSVCGVVGKRPSLLLTDAATALGSEGGPVFTEGPTKELVGTVVCSVSWCRGEWVGLTLVAPLVCVLAAKLRVADPHPPKPLAAHPLQHVLKQIDSCTVLVRCGHAWGAGVHLGGGYVLTCAHVVKSYQNHKLSVYCQGVNETAIVRYKTPDKKAYDLALLFTNPERLSHMKSAKLSNVPAEKGESVLAAGFPYYNEFDLTNLIPTITSGHVNTVSPSMIQTSCCVQSGFSGGPIFRVTRPHNRVEVIGIIAINVTSDGGACFPYVNMAVPVTVFRDLLAQYILDKGMEVYSEFCGPCLATAYAIRKGKLEIGQDKIAMVKCCADYIDALSRFKGKSEPVFLFIVNGKLTRSMFGANGIDLCRIIVEELEFFDREAQGIELDRPRLEITDMLPEEAVKMEENLQLEEEYKEAAERLRVLTLAARKKRINDRLSVYLKRLNFIMYWPHCHKAHIDLYEKWDDINITVYAKEEFQLDEKSAKETLYMSDVDPNEACLHALTKGRVLVVLFRMYDTDNRDFVKLLRYALYEDIPVPKEDVPPEKQVPPIPAYERYATISKTAREVRRERYNQYLQKLREQEEEAARLAAEQERIAKEAAENEARIQKQRMEEARMARIAAGLPADPEPEPEPEPVPEPEQESEPPAEEKEQDQVAVEQKEVDESEEKPAGEVEETTAVSVEEDPEAVADEEWDIEMMEGTEYAPTEGTEFMGEGEGEEKPEEDEGFHSDVEVEGEEYIPPGGLFVPGLYTPPNELAKANGLAFFFPKHVLSLAGTIETEYLPPHVLVIFPIEKRFDVLEVIKQYPTEILNVGIFVGDDPYTAQHIAYTIKQYNSMERPLKRGVVDRLALMVSRKRSITLLQLAGLNPVYISSDVVNGEKECLAMFPVGYGDDYEEVVSVEETEVEDVEPDAGQAGEGETEEAGVGVNVTESRVLGATSSMLPLSSSMMPLESMNAISTMDTVNG